MIAEFALKPHAVMAPHSNPNLSYLIVIEGGGFVQVGDERARVAAGEAVVWPRDVVHSVWTDLTPMRAIVVEFAADEGAVEAKGAVEPLLIEGETADVAATGAATAAATVAAAAAVATGAATGAAAESVSAAASPSPTVARADGSLAPKPVGPPDERRSPESEPW